jgi:hypothetical protein
MIVGQHEDDVARLVLRTRAGLWFSGPRQTGERTRKGGKGRHDEGCQNKCQYVSRCLNLVRHLLHLKGWII